MNRIGAGPNMTFTIIGLFAFIAVISLGILATNQFIEANTPVNQSDNSIQAQALSNLTAQQSNLEDATTQVTGGGFIQGVFGLGNVIFTTMLIGVQAILSLVSLPIVINNLINTVFEGFGFGGPALLIVKTFLYSVIGIYVTMKVMQAIRGTPTEA